MPSLQLLYALDFGNDSSYASHECQKWKRWRSQKALVLLQSWAILKIMWFCCFQIRERKRVKIDTWASIAPAFQTTNVAGTFIGYINMRDNTIQSKPGKHPHPLSFKKNIQWSRSTYLSIKLCNISILHVQPACQTLIKQTSKHQHPMR